LKMGPNALVSAENESGRVKRENGTRRPPYRRKRVRERKTRKREMTPSVRPKLSLGVQNMKTGPDPLLQPKTSQGAKYMKTPFVPQKMSSGAQKLKIGPHALGTAENEFGRAKHEKCSRRPLYRRK
jgi:hypothetical protein